MTEGEQLQEDKSVFEREFKVVVEILWKEDGNQAAISAEAKSRPEKSASGGDDWKVKHLLLMFSPPLLCVELRTCGV